MTKKIELPEYACAPTLKVSIVEPSCEHDWKSRETDDMIYYRCTKCGSHASCEVYD